MCLLLVAVLYPLVPAPNIEPLASQGFIGDLYVNLYTFFRIAQNNLAVYIAVAIAAFLAIPVSVLLTDRQFMREYKFPVKIQTQVLMRERPFAFRMMAYTLFLAPVAVALVMISLYLSAVIASWSHSAILGICALGILPFIALLAAQLVMTRTFRGSLICSHGSVAMTPGLSGKIIMRRPAEACHMRALT